MAICGRGARRSRRSPARSGSVVSLELSCTSRLLAVRSFSYSSARSRRNKFGAEGLTDLRASLDVGFRQRRALVQPLPHDAQSNLTCGHVFHQIEHSVVAEKIRGLQRRRLHPLAERVAVLHRHAHQIAGAANRPRGIFERDERFRIIGRVGKGRKRRPSWFSCPDPLPDGPQDMDHLPVGDPLAAGAFALFALGAGHAPVSCPPSHLPRDPTGMLGSMPPCHNANRPVASGVLTARRTRSS